MAIGYRAILSAEYNNGNLASTVDVLRKWVTQKKGFNALPSEGEALANAAGATLVANEISESDRGVSGYRWTLTEEWTAPRWYRNTETDRTGVTQISLVFSNGQLWLWVDVEPPTLEYVDSAGRERVEQQPSGTPAFVTDILREVEMRDGLENPASEIDVIATNLHVTHLIRVLRDPERRGAVYVTTPPEGVSDKVWLERGHRILGRIEGMGFGYMLTPEARNAFNSTVASGHTIPAGAMRTFLPGANLDDPRDSLRHRLLHASTIQESQDRRLQRIIRNAQVERLRDVQLPNPLRDADYAFLRQKGLRTFEILHSTDTVAAEEPNADQSAELLRNLAEAEELVTLALNENEVLRAAATSAQAAVEALRAENEEAYIDAVGLRLDVEKGRREIDHLRRELTRLGAEGAAAAYAFSDEPAAIEYPSTFRELIYRLDLLSGIRFFGKRDDAEDLDEYSDLGDAAVMRAWDALVTFSAYATARAKGQFDQSLSHYISNSQHGLPMRISKVKWSEGETVRTNAKMMAQRTVSGLPETIDPSGSKLLVAHIALATGRAGSPRLYFEDTVAAAGFVAVGYIGAHLDNTLTN
ncbi:hypothetical protein C5C53_07825 [Rathayibacter sp. AY1E3]|uniref:hypothetical protein n=1 Tax=Rathayibacter sp. AY1E3 TaxID=2080551 RepID=UPI000CE8B378|nr:hypothetical protein [Rathayibacter sp. AY1E3]PPH37215.1 hypothetical protein C5C53_07825 [Rathayibacter sp. AY1E3]